MECLAHTMHSGTHGLSTFPGLVKKLLIEKCWKHRLLSRLGHNEIEIKFDSFLDFVVSSPLKGLGATPQIVRHLCKDDPEALVLLEEELARSRGGANNPEGLGGHTGKGREEVVNVLNKNIDNATPPEKPRGGTDNQAYAIRRLGRERPDLLGQVKAGELSAHRAMIEAGFRKELTQLETLQKAWKKATAEEKEAFLREVTQ